MASNQREFQGVTVSAIHEYMAAEHGQRGRVARRHNVDQSRLSNTSVDYQVHQMGGYVDWESFTTEEREDLVPQYLACRRRGGRTELAVRHRVRPSVLSREARRRKRRGAEATLTAASVTVPPAPATNGHTDPRLKLLRKVWAREMQPEQALELLDLLTELT